MTSLTSTRVTAVAGTKAPGAPRSSAQARRARERAAAASLLVALVVLALKALAWWSTGSVTLLSDAAESIVNVTAALSLMFALRLAARGPDYQHPYGHQKAEYLSSVFEATLILLAAGAIAVSAVERLFAPQPLERVTFGLTLAMIATLLNALLAAYLIERGRTLRSPALTANGRHVRTDVWSSLAAFTGLALAVASGWLLLDPLLAIAVAVHVAREGVLILTNNLSKLMDERLPAAEEQVILDALREHPQVLGFHRLRTRRSGRARFAEVDVFVDPRMSVRAAHEVIGAVENRVHAQLEELVTTLHVEPFVAGEREGERMPADEFEPPADR